MSDASTAGQAAPASGSGSTPAAPVNVESLVERFRHPPATTPSAYFQLVGRDFHSFVSAVSVQLGRHSKLPAGTPLPQALPAPPFPTAASATPGAAAPPTVGVSLGDAHTISRSHMHLGWNATARRWEARALGKNGFWMDRTKYIPLDCDPASAAGMLSGAVAVAQPCPLPSDQASLLRIGVGEQATLFYFVPALNAPGAAASGAQPAKKKRKQSDVAGGSGGGGGGGDKDGGSSQKQKRKKSASGVVAVSSADAIDDDAPLSQLLAQPLPTH